jgi:Domain of unknown function (DUF4386)
MAMPTRQHGADSRGTGVVAMRDVSATSSSRRFYRIAGAAAVAVVVIAVLQAPIFILYPQPTTVMGHFTQFQSNKFLGLLDLDLMLMLGEAVSVLVLLGLYVALRRVSPSAMTVAVGLGLAGIALYFAVNPTFSMLYLSDQYAAATTDAQRAAFLAAGEALWANYNGTAFGLFFILTGAADLVIAAVMLRSGVFSRTTAYVGFVLGAMLLVPPLPVLGTVPLVLSYVVIVPSVIWEVLLARRFFQLASGAAAQGGGGE